jgi:hypothetical protein
LAAPVALLLAATFHIAVTAHMAGDEIRVSLSDCILPLLAVVFAWRVLSGAAVAPHVARGALIWLAALSLWFTIALFIGHAEIGAWQAWALLNKYVGWYVLLAYFALGACVAAEDRGTRRLLRPLLQVFIAAACVISLVGFARVVGAQMGLPAIGLTWNREEGLLANPNAFGVIMATLWSLLAAFRREGGRRWTGSPRASRSPLRSIRARAAATSGSPWRRLRFSPFARSTCVRCCVTWRRRR